MQRVLDLDLDFFVHGVEHWASEGRLNAEDYPPWDLDDVLAFLRDRCCLDKALPGAAVEQHYDVFFRWRDAIDAGALVPPFHVTHVDAHADLGLGDNGYVYLMSSLLFEDVGDRRDPVLGDLGEGAGVGLASSNYLLFAIACRWLSELVYVSNTAGNGSPGDLLYFAMENFDPSASRIQLAAVDGDEWRHLGPGFRPKVERLEPPVPFKWTGWPTFKATEPYDFVFLARSVEYTPSESDAIFDEIRHRFIDESVFPL